MRLSVGIEHVDDLVADVDQALAKAEARSRTNRVARADPDIFPPVPASVSPPDGRNAVPTIPRCPPPASLCCPRPCSASAPRPPRRSLRSLNVSYDPTRELYAGLQRRLRRSTGRPGDRARRSTIQQSHGGSGKQARAVIDGLEADVVTPGPGLRHRRHRRGARLLADDWQTRLPHNSAPYTSTIVFLRPQGQPEGHPATGATSCGPASR